MRSGFLLSFIVLVAGISAMQQSRLFPSWVVAPTSITVRPLSPILVKAWYVRNDGSSTVNCTGQADAAYDGSGIGEACAYSNFQNALDAASCGDTINLKAGHTFNAPGVFQAFSVNKACSAGSVLTIQSSGVGSLPSGRVSPSNASNMSRLRALGGSGALRFEANTAFVTIDGLELTNTGTDTANEMVQNLITAGSNSINHITIQRSYLHPKEYPGTYTRVSMVRALQYEGSFLTFKWNHAAGFHGRLKSDNSVLTSSIILTVQGNNFTVSDNFMEAWYVAIFTGGGREDPEFTATISSASTTQATFSSTTGLSVGQYVRFELRGTLTVNSNNNHCEENQGATQEICAAVTYNTGQTPTTADAAHTVWLENGGPIFSGRIDPLNSPPNRIYPYSGQVPTGSYNFRIFEVAKVTNIAGSVVNYTPIGLNFLTQAPSTATNATSWRTNQVIHDLAITKNTIEVDYANAAAEHASFGNSPKGWVELKAGDTILFEGNIFTGYDTTMGISQHSDEGATPWTAVNNLTIRSNFFRPDLTGNGEARAFAQIALTDPYNSDQPGHTTLIENNLIFGCELAILFQGVDGIIIRHNTIINDQQGTTDVNAMIEAFTNDNFGLDFRDNIILNNASGMVCLIGSLNTCWPAHVKLNNVIVDNTNNGNLASVYGPGILSPIVTSTSGVGFVGATSTCFASPTNCALGPSSPFKNRATDSTDPGVNITALLAALSSTPAPTPSPTPPQPGSICRWNTTPPCRVP